MIARTASTALVAAGTLFGALSLSPALAQQGGDAILGFWKTPHGATVEVVPCATGICGDIVEMDAQDGVPGPQVRDVNHPNPDRRDRKLLGTRIMRKVVKTGPNEWKGRAYHPKHGLRMAPTITLVGDGRMKLTACLKKAPSICQDEYWQRVNGS
ncbi:uncharacterized protein (DUF2147 family) [Rhodobium orientis]|uniref:DUF2147 domain-containing protein n=1 Tax=Rhodobium orientis TaxID=34017 RepID=A0A327JVD7_9HYPH|nr:DUF2147 domain-containing protein [Rhodobium orientis]MBB4304005.1 uncharacterized protein (DUF2147 family) [Rhodobium orientis]RAI29545.1 hypothetical protein CH339_02545 [Rhodobium orientis]